MIKELIHILTLLMELLGVAVVVIGACIALFSYFRAVLQKETTSYDRLRSSLGRSILLGLEFLVAADIINTVAIDPTLSSVMVLGLIVLIRTFLSFSLNVEIEGHLPWQKKQNSLRPNQKE